MNISIGDLIAQFKDPKPEPEHTDVNQWFGNFQEWLAGSYERTVHAPRKPGLHASALGKVCARRNLLLAAFGTNTVPNSAGNYFTYDMGHALHFWWQERYLGPKQELWGDWMCVACACKTCNGTKTYKVDGQTLRCDTCRSSGRKVTRGLMPMNCECGVPWQDAIRYMELPVVDEELDYCGHTDGILNHKPKQRLFEFKTIGPSEYDKLSKGPKEEHVIQAHAYMGPLGLDEAIIVYQNKGSQCKWSVNMFGQFVAGEPKVIPFLVRYDQDLWDGVVVRIHDHHRSMALLDNLEKGGRPTRMDIAQFGRVCENAKCELAQRCPVSRECFTLDAPK